MFKFTYFLLLTTSLSFSQNPVQEFHKQLNDSKTTGIALILANEYYKNSTNLKLTRKNGKQISQSLKNIGFDVLEGYDLSRDQMLESIMSVSEKIKDYDKIIVFYSGHGIQFDNENFLLPSDTKASTNAGALAASAISINDLLQILKSPTIPKLIVLDACRENPFRKLIFDASRSVAGQGLATVESSINTMMLFSTSYNTIVSDNNPFTQVFSKNLENGGCLEQIIKRTRNEILSKNKKQLIWSGGSLTGNMCFGLEKYATSFKDIDEDGIGDEFDNCPNINGPLENFGCPEDKSNWYKKGLIYYQQNKYDEAILWFKKAANENSDNAKFYLGYMFYNGEGTTRDEEVGIQYATEAAYSENLTAINFLIAVYGNRRDWKNQAFWLKLAVSLGDINSHSDLGYRYIVGAGGVNEDLEQGRKLLEVAAKANNKSAQLHLGIYYMKLKEFDKALYWLKKAEEQGMHSSFESQAFIYLELQEYDKAHHYLKKWAAFDKYSPVAASELASFYYKIKFDYQNALAWYEKSCEMGKREDCQIAENIESRIKG